MNYLRKLLPKEPEGRINKKKTGSWWKNCLQPLLYCGGCRKQQMRSAEWQMLKGLIDGQLFDLKPNVLDGYLLMKWKSPQKGWHKRYFVLDEGILAYAKSPCRISQGKTHGSVDVGLSIVSTERISCRIEIDSGDGIYQLKAKSSKLYMRWVETMRSHRLYRQHVISYGERSLNKPLTPKTCDKGTTTTDFCVNGGPGMAAVSGSTGERNLATWVEESAPRLDIITRELVLTKCNLENLTSILDSLSNIPFRNTEGVVTSASEGLQPSPTSDNQLREDFVILANDVHSCLWNLLCSLEDEKKRLQSAMEADAGKTKEKGLGAEVDQSESTLCSTVLQLHSGAEQV